MYGRKCANLYVHTLCIVGIKINDLTVMNRIQCTVTVIIGSFIIHVTVNDICGPTCWEVDDPVVGLYSEEQNVNHKYRTKRVFSDLES